MKLSFFFIATSALITAAALPVGKPPPPQASSSGLDLNDGIDIQKVGFGDTGGQMTAADKQGAENAMKFHYKYDVKSEDERKQAALAYSKNGWINDHTSDLYRQHLEFTYHQEEHPESKQIGESVKQTRATALPKTYSQGKLTTNNDIELKAAMHEHFLALPYDKAKLVQSMNAPENWKAVSGSREELKITGHKGSRPNAYNKVALEGSETLYRPSKPLGNLPVTQGKKRKGEESSTAVGKGKRQSTASTSAP